MTFRKGLQSRDGHSMMLRLSRNELTTILWLWPSVGTRKNCQEQRLIREAAQQALLWVRIQQVRILRVRVVKAILELSLVAWWEVLCCLLYLGFWGTLNGVGGVEDPDIKPRNHGPSMDPDWQVRISHLNLSASLRVRLLPYLRRAKLVDFKVKVDALACSRDDHGIEPCHHSSTTYLVFPGPLDIIDLTANSLAISPECSLPLILVFFGLRCDH